jgi:hypothetical protein
MKRIVLTIAFIAAATQASAQMQPIPFTGYTTTNPFVAAQQQQEMLEQQQEQTRIMQQQLELQRQQQVQEQMQQIQQQLPLQTRSSYGN